VTGATTGELLGSLGVHWLDLDQRVAEIGYWVRREARGQGGAARAVRVAAGWGVEQGGGVRRPVRGGAEQGGAPSRAEATRFPAGGRAALGALQHTPAQAGRFRDLFTAPRRARGVGTRRARRDG